MPHPFRHPARSGKKETLDQLVCVTQLLDTSAAAIFLLQRPLCQTLTLLWMEEDIMGHQLYSLVSKHCMAKTTEEEISSFGISDPNNVCYLKLHSNTYCESIIASLARTIGVLCCAHVTCSMQITGKLGDCFKLCSERSVYIYNPNPVYFTWGSKVSHIYLFKVIAPFCTVATWARQSFHTDMSILWKRSGLEC